MPEVQTITIACKMKVSSDLAKEIDETLLTFAVACDWINQNTPVKLTNKTAMQSLVYQDVRAKFGLSSNLAIQAVRRVCANRKTAKQKGKTVKEFSPTSISYDARIFSFKESDWTVSLKLLNKRHKFELLIGNYQRGILKGTFPTSATLVKRKTGDYYIHIQIDKLVPDPIKADDVIGVDLGRTDIAVTSDGESWSGKKITDLRNHYAILRAILQRKAPLGMRTTRRRCRQLLKRLSGHEKRFQKHINHVISRKLVNNAVANHMAIAIEDLTGIRERTNQNPRSKKDKRLGNNWAFYQLRQYLTYKCLLAGVKLILVSPAHTSQTCHKCFVIGDRNGKGFTCSSCGSFDADWNGSNNIKALGVLINHPRGTGLSCEIKRKVQYIQLNLFDALGLPKTPSSSRGNEGFAWGSL